MRKWFYVTLLLLFAAEILGGYLWPPLLWSLAVAVPLAVVGIFDVAQTRHTILRNFPLIGHARFLFEALRPEIQQYFIETNVDPHPIERELRNIVYERAKDAPDTKPFGTERNVYAVGYEWVAHSLQPAEPPAADPRVRIGSGQCPRPYDASLLNISAMSFGALSPSAIRALNQGARRGGFAHNTGEGGLSDYHLEAGGDLIWQIGTGYFGCRTPDGKFDPAAFRDGASHDAVRMIEIKLSQGAKPGHGGVLPARKVTEEIARIRHVPVGQTVISPPRHSAFRSPTGLLEFAARLRELAGGKPVGIKVCLGTRLEFLAVCRAMLETGILLDFVTVDGGEGGTGAAPLEFSNFVGMPAREAWVLVHNALTGAGLRDEVKILASGKILTGFDMVRAFATGADACNSARGFMLALGCIQALRCNTDRCPTGVATQNPWLFRGLVVKDKAERVAHYHRATLDSLRDLLVAMGCSRPAEVGPERVFRRVSAVEVVSYAQLYERIAPGSLVDRSAPQAWLRDWDRATAERFAPASG